MYIYSLSYKTPKDNQHVICETISFLSCECEVHYIGLRKAKFEGVYLRNNAMNQKSPRGISGEILLEHRILI